MGSSEREQFETYMRTPDRFAGLLERDDDGEYKWHDVREQWSTWQAARRAQASAEPVATVYTMEALVPGGSVKHHAQMHKALPAGTKLYAAPQQAPSDYVLQLLVAAGHVTQSKVDEARAIASDLGISADKGATHG